MNKIIYRINLFALLFFLVLLIHTQETRSEPYNGFDLSDSSIPKDEILSGGPPRDGIPAITEPKFISENETTWLNDDDLVIGVSADGISKAYPFRILVWHEAVNDEINGEPIMVNYCPLCGSAMVFNRIIRGKTFTFGISGLLYQSNVLFYDHQTESLWSQLDMKAVSGKMKGAEFEVYPSTMATWKEWKMQHPDSLVLSRDTGFERDYNRDPYSGYEESGSVMFPVKRKSEQYHPKEKILVVISGDNMKAYPFSELEKGNDKLIDKVGDNEVHINFNDGKNVEVQSKDKDQQLKSLVTYWFAWYAFKPDTPVYKIRD